MNQCPKRRMNIWLCDCCHVKVYQRGKQTILKCKKVKEAKVLGNKHLTVMFFGVRLQLNIREIETWKPIEPCLDPIGCYIFLSWCKHVRHMFSMVQNKRKGKLPMVQLQYCLQKPICQGRAKVSAQNHSLLSSDSYASLSEHKGQA